MIATRWLSPLLLAVLALLLALPAGLAQGQTPPQQEDGSRTRTFAQTGHTVSDAFLETWERTPNALFTLGYPISQPFMEESFTNPGQMYRVQYFERAILEKHPENLGVTDDRFYVLGRLLGARLALGREEEPPFVPVADPGDGTWIAATQHTLRNEPAPFRAFWEQNGSLEVFGYPISEQFREINAADGQPYWVQYFERQRMEWHPDDAAAPIQLGLLGNEYRDQFHQANSAFTPGAPVQSAPNPGSFIYGYNVHLYAERDHWQDRERLLDMAKETDFFWVRQQVAWMNIEAVRGYYNWGELDAIVEDVNAAGMQLMVSVVRAPNWATADRRNGMPEARHYPTFAAFMGRMAARYQGRIAAYEVWNEQNLAHENGGRVANADDYVAMLAQAYDAIKAADPQAVVVSGALSPTETNRPDVAISDVTFMRQMLANPAFRADVIGAHPGGQHNPPDTLWPDNPGPGPGWVESREFYFRRVEDIRQAMVEAGYGERQIWLTEFGWATANTSPGYEYGNNNTLEEQAAYIVRAFEKGRYEYQPWLGGMFLWNLNFAIPWANVENNELHEQASFGILNGDWTPRPAWYALRDMPKE